MAKKKSDDLLKKQPINEQTNVFPAKHLNHLEENLLEQKNHDALIKKPKSRRKLKRFIFVMSVILFIFMIFGSVTILGMGAWQNFDASKITNANQTLLLYDKEGALITSIYGTENRLNVTLDQIPQHVRNALVAMEDIRFYEHSGIDLKRVVGALVADLRAGSLQQGASTITQQLIKLSHLTNEKTWTRKLQEAVLAVQMEQNYSKDEIMEMYFNYVYFGAGAYGIEAASQEYFNKSCSSLTIAEGALLVGVLKSPSNYAPHLNLAASIERRDLVLSQMYTYGFINDEEYIQAVSETVTLDMREDSLYPHGFYTELAMSEAREILGVNQETLLSGGYRIYTALDSSIQIECEILFDDDSLFPEPINDKPTQGAMVVIDPQTFQINALMGGREHLVQMGLNRATQVKRQPGSAIKPVLVYAPALEKYGYTAATFLLDEQTDFSGYEPRNFGDQYYGWVTMRQAITNSLNVPAVKVLSDIGVYSAKSYAESVGIEFDANDRNLSLALGGFTYGVTPLQLTGAYGAFASGGLYQEPYCVTKITDASGKTLYEAQQNPQRVMSEENAFILTSMLQSVITDGTGRRLNIDIPLAGKTGTTGLVETGGNKDAWMVAYNTEYVATIWMGYDDTNETYALPNDTTGGTYPAAILARLFESIYPNKEDAPDFIQPDGVVAVQLDSSSLTGRRQLLLSNALTPSEDVQIEYFTLDTVPTQSTDYWVIPTPPGELTVEPNDDGTPVIRFAPEERFVLYQLYRLDGNATVLVNTSTETPEDALLLGEFPGDNGEICYVDEAAVYGKTYSYFVVPVHPELSISGEQVQGPTSTCVVYSVTAPSYTIAPALEANAQSDETLADAIAGSPSPVNSVEPENNDQNDPLPESSPNETVAAQTSSPTATPKATPSPSPTPAPTATYSNPPTPQPVEDSVPSPQDNASNSPEAFQFY